jgi:hypothetical protein
MRLSLAIVVLLPLGSLAALNGRCTGSKATGEWKDRGICVKTSSCKKYKGRTTNGACPYDDDDVKCCLVDSCGPIPDTYLGPYSGCQWTSSQCAPSDWLTSRCSLSLFGTEVCRLMRRRPLSWWKQLQMLHHSLNLKPPKCYSSTSNPWCSLQTTRIRHAGPRARKVDETACASSLAGSQEPR